MTTEEALYWKQYIDKTVAEKLSATSGTQQDALRIKQFAESHMQGITGQQLLPQATFRQFLEMFAHLPAIQEGIEQAQDEINETVSGCTDKEMEQVLDGLMWDEDYMWLPSMDIDEEGFVELDFEIDENGWAHFVDE